MDDEQDVQLSNEELLVQRIEGFAVKGTTTFDDLWTILPMIRTRTHAKVVTKESFFKEHEQEWLARLQHLIIQKAFDDPQRAAGAHRILTEAGDMQQLNNSEVLTVLIDIIWEAKGSVQHVSATELVCEVLRNDIVNPISFAKFDRFFINYLLDIVESSRDDINTSLNYATTKLVLAINEQYAIKNSSASIDNVVMEVLAERGTSLRTFSENVALFFNRGGDQDIVDGPDESLQILLLKFLFLVFSKRATADMFYPNDLRVIVDIIIRELLNLPVDNITLRQGYLRVLYGLLNISPYRRHGRHKCAEISKLLESILLDPKSDANSKQMVQQIFLDCSDALNL